MEKYLYVIQQPITIVAIIIFIILCIIIENASKQNKTKKKRTRNKKYHTFKNSYYDEVRHFSKQHDYIEDIWNEIK